MKRLKLPTPVALANERTRLLQAERNIYEDDAEAAVIAAASSAADSAGRPIYDDDNANGGDVGRGRSCGHLQGHRWRSSDAAPAAASAGAIKPPPGIVEYSRQPLAAAAASVRGRYEDLDADDGSGLSAARSRGSLWMVRFVFFIQCAAYCCVCNFLVLFFHYKNLTNSEIGLILGGVYPAAQLLGQPIGCWVADRFGCHKAMIVLCLVVGSAVQFMLKCADGLVPLAATTGASALLLSSVGPMIDNAAMHTLGRHNIPRTDYGKFRVFGALGWGLAALGLGPALDEWGIDVLFYAYAGVSFVWAIAIMFFKVSIPRHAAGQTPSAPGQARPQRMSTARYLRVLLGTPGTVLFLFLVMVMGVCKATIDVFLFLYLQNELGASSALLGISLLVTTLGEIPFFFFSGELFRKYGTLQVIVFALAAYGVRTAYYAFLHDMGHHTSVAYGPQPSGVNVTHPCGLNVTETVCSSGNPWLVLPVELLHGVTFSLSWSAVASHAQAISPPGYTATTQGLVSATFSGLGFAIGGIGGGYVIDAYGPVRLYQGTAILAASAAVVGAWAVALMRACSSSPDGHAKGSPQEEEDGPPKASARARRGLASYTQ